MLVIISVDADENGLAILANLYCRGRRYAAEGPKAASAGVPHSRRRMAPGLGINERGQVKEDRGCTPALGRLGGVLHRSHQRIVEGDLVAPALARPRSSTTW